MVVRDPAIFGAPGDLPDRDEPNSSRVEGWYNCGRVAMAARLER